MGDSPFRVVTGEDLRQMEKHKTAWRKKEADERARLKYCKAYLEEITDIELCEELTRRAYRRLRGT